MLCKSCIGLTSQPKLVSREALAYGSENLHNRAGARWKCTPFGADAPPFPRRGNFSCRLALGLMSTTKYHAAKISPLRGRRRRRRQKGCISHVETLQRVSKSGEVGPWPAHKRTFQ